MELGDIDKALTFYQLVLRNDPDQHEVGRQYKGLKKLQKLLKNVDEKLAKSQNHKALEGLSEVLSAMKGMEADSGHFRSGILLRLCKVNGEMKRAEEALYNCDQAVKQRQTPISGTFVHPLKLAEALAARCRALIQDHDYDEAVRDCRAAVDEYERSGKTEAIQTAQHKFQEAQQLQREWQQRRDHGVILELPVNLDQLSKEKRCHWVKKQHKALARKWHPDKARGDKIRAARKMREVSEAKEALNNQYGC